MHSTHLRREAIHGLLVGTACGESIGMSHHCTRRRRLLRIASDRDGKVWSRAGYYGSDTHLMLMAAQSVLNSGSTLSGFSQSFMRRLIWYPLSFPVGMSLATRWAATVGWLHKIGVPSGFHSVENSPLTRASFVALALHGTGHSLKKWIEGSTKLTHSHRGAFDACLVLAMLAEIAANSKHKGLEPVEVLQRLAAKCPQASMQQKLDILGEQISKRRSPRAVAKHFGWQHRIPKDAESTVVMACYCFLLFPKDFYRAVNAACLLGGDRSSLCAVVGGLVGAHVGFCGLPENAQSCRFPFPHGQAWMAEMAERMSHWPHGVEDLNAAPSLISWPLMQMQRNLLQHFLRLVSFWLLLPCKFVELARRSIQH